MTGASLFVWIRRIHYALGLYLLLFIWLFALSGLLLNHEWKFAEFWENRVETTVQKPIRQPLAADDLATANALMQQLGIRGEVNKIERSTAGDVFTFDVTRPGESDKVEALLAQGRAKITHIDMNGWGVFRTLHTFTGSKYGEPERRRDWVATSLWVTAMLATAIGLIAMVLTSLYLWWRLNRKRAPGGAALGLGVLATAFFLWGLRVAF